MTNSTMPSKHKATGRNDPCPCGSGKKYKQCCLPRDEASVAKQGASAAPVRDLVQAAVAHHQAGRLGEAETLYQQVLQAEPNQPDALHLLGVIAHQSGRHQNAIEWISKALGIKPTALMHSNLGLAFDALGKRDNAVDSFRQAIALEPKFVDAYINLGATYKDLGKFEEAVASYRKALSLKPDYAEAQFNLGVALQGQGKLDDAIECYRSAIASKPGLDKAHLNLGNVLKDLGRLNEAAASYRRVLAISPEHNEAYSNMLLAMLYAEGNSAEAIFAAHQDYAKRFEAPLKLRWQAHDNAIDPHRRLKIGYLSPDFRAHSVAYFIEPVLAHHDKNAVEITCYYNNFTQDAFTERIKRHADHWVDCARLSNDELAQRVRSDKIDILVDLAGHTANNRLLTFARKPAPIQSTWIGYAATTGLSAMDYRLTDSYAEPPGMTEHLNVEALWRLPGCFCCYQENEKSLPVAPHPPSDDNGYVTFGSLNNFVKVSDATLAVWAQILMRVPTARVLFEIKGVDRPAVRADVEARLARFGFPLERVILEPRSGNQFALYKQIDIALDPFPYNGTTTSMETLWMGVPFIALEGRNLVSRMGVTILANAGLPELIADTPDTYVDLAARLATNREYLHAVRNDLRQKVAASSLMDAAKFTRELEEAYRGMWAAYCRKDAHAKS